MEEQETNESDNLASEEHTQKSEEGQAKSVRDKEQLEEFLEIDYSDGRLPGDYKSVYPENARKIYRNETRFYALVAVLTMCFLFGLFLALVVYEKNLEAYYESPFLSPYKGSRSYLAASLFRLLIVFLSGAAGGSLFALRNVSNLIFLRYWHEDRILWRISFPFIGGVVATFLALLNLGGILAPFRENQFYSPTFCAGYGFVVGYFSDSVLRTLSRIAGDFLENIKSREMHQTPKNK
ncbi:hypothetical protein [Synechococcus sp. PCC 6312]|uniref:hypothetical protein n=1 Tax=Synechococcus sp. (strain ATCC 27167 / PCC 6312) TaxID=195253 RepID=UPI00029F05F5|nr:hypothetical protein [Synechococcus sp. PCC 6312]AFY61798.1 hypothetical protein Syn6312_2712 [Synechococcus sp. PCC 6312]